MVSLTVLAARCRALQINANEPPPVLNCQSAPIVSTTVLARSPDLDLLAVAGSG
jgi:hypothetical protein